MKLLAIDGNSIVNRAFFGIRMLNAPDGTPTNAVYGFLSTLQRLLEEETPDAVAVAFDLRAPTFRHLRYEGYKAQRKGMPEDLAVQMPVLKDVLDAMGIMRLELEGFEADDLLGSVSRRCEASGDECVIATGDRDSFQLITERTRVLHTKTLSDRTETVNYTKERFEEEYGFAPPRLVDLKALMGDASDNIPGVAGVGEKTALALVRRYDSVDKIYSDLDALDVKDAVRKKLREGEDSARMSYELATIVTDAPVAFDLEAARWNADYRPELYHLCLKLGFTKFIEKWGLRPAAAVTVTEAPESARGVGGVLYVGDLTEAPAPEIPKAGHNVKDLQRALLERGIPPENWVFDTALAGYLLDATAGSYDLRRLCVQYCGFEPGSETVALAALHRPMEEKLAALGMKSLYYDIELPLCPVLAEMEHEGFLVDRAALKEFGESMTDTIGALQQSVWRQAGEEFNINSPKQLGKVLFETLMLPAGKKTKTGWSTNADVLEKLRDKHPIINEVLKYRELTKLKSTYADGLLKVIAPDGRIHTSFMMTVTDTGRLSSREPNLQNIPIRREFGGQIRKMFVAPEGSVLVDADYSQIELRLLAHISKDENMIAAFQSGEDIHAVTASQVFGIPLEQVTRLQRSHAKAVNFGIVYGISAWSLAQDIGVFPNEAKAYMDAYLEKYHGVRDYQKDVIAKAKADGYVSTLFGRRRALPELKNSNFAVRSFGERVALNMPIQGTAADVIKLAMVRVWRRLKREKLRAKLILQVHDELIAECPEDEAETVKALLIEEMQNAAEFSVPLLVDANIGKSWAEAHS